MISTEVALIMTAGGIGGAILVSQMTLRNWFKRETFKFKQQADRKEMNLRFKKMEKDMNLKESTPIPPREKTLVETLGEINPEVIKTLAGALTKDDAYESDYEEQPAKPDIAEIIADVAKSNPELVTTLIDKFTKKPVEGAANEWKSQE